LILKLSSGILVYKIIESIPYFLLAHPGGPFYKNKDDGCWTIPKGMVIEGESLWNAALREFHEETNLIFDTDNYMQLPVVKYKNGKVLHAFAVQADLDLKKFKSNLFEARWIKGSSELKSYPEIDRIEYFDQRSASKKIHPVQLPFLQFILTKY
jgi:predicted NUDIX family NTP pyrophosphohydrolase